MKTIKSKKGPNITNGAFSLMAVIFAVLASTSPAFATASTISQNIVESVTDLPSVLSGLSYLLGIVLGVKGIFDFKTAVDQPNGQTTMRHGITSMLAGGAFFALPIIYTAAENTIAPNGGGFSLGLTIATGISGLTGMMASFIPNQSFNQILGNIVTSVEDVPSLITAAAYLLGILFGALAIIKTKDHIDNPGNTKLKEGVIRFLMAGVMFAIPTVYGAMFDMINGDGSGFLGGLAQVFIAATSAGVTTEVAAGGSIVPGLGCSPVPGTGFIRTFFGGGSTIGVVICNVFRSTLSWPGFLTAIAYLFGLIIGIWGILKIQDHVLDPNSTKIWDGIARLVVAGGLFALPSVVAATYNTVAAIIIPHVNTGFADQGASGGGLDRMLTLLMMDVLGPMALIVQWFGVVAGFALVFIGITRLMKSAQEGPKGPGGLGTILTFVVGGALLSFSPMITAASGSIFANPITFTNGAATGGGYLEYTAGMTATEVAHANAVIAAIIKFVLVVGLISVMRGIFMLREIGEGGQQASMMGCITHIVGGAIAVNLGPMLMAVQNTLGITGLGLGLRFG